MNPKLKNPCHELGLTIVMAIMVAAQVGCQHIPTNSILFAPSHPNSLVHPFPENQKIDDVPGSNPIGDLGNYEPLESVLIDDEFANHAFDDSPGRPPFESDNVSFSFTDSTPQTGVIANSHLAQVHFEDSVTYHPNQSPPLVSEAFRDHSANRIGLAVDQATQHIVRPPDSHPQQTGWEAAFKMARMLESQDNLPKAAEIYESLVKQGYQRPEIFHRLAVCYDQTSRSQLALPFYEQALDLDPQNPEILCDLGYRLQLSGNVKAAERFYNLALTYDPQHLRANNHLGVLLAQDNRKDDAYKTFRAAGLNIWQAKRNVNASLHNRELGVIHQ